MRTRRFAYIGKSNALLVGSNRLVKGEPFETDDMALATFLSSLVDVEEVTTTKKPDSKKASPKEDAGES